MALDRRTIPYEDRVLLYEIEREMDGHFTVVEVSRRKVISTDSYADAVAWISGWPYQPPTLSCDGSAAPGEAQ